MLIEWLHRLNYKERYFLFKQVVGGVRLSDDFRHQLGEKFGISVPEDAAVLLDYHLDWLHAALELTKASNTDGGTFSNDGRVANGTQEDVDLLVAFEQGQETHLLLIEAKGKGAWSTAQTKSKTSRLREIFGEDGAAYKGVRPHLGLMSPRPPGRLNPAGLPTWMLRGSRVVWLPMTIDSDRWELYRIARTDSASRPWPRFGVSRAGARLR